MDLTKSGGESSVVGSDRQFDWKRMSGVPRKWPMGNQFINDVCMKCMGSVGVRQLDYVLRNTETR